MSIISCVVSFALWWFRILYKSTMNVKYCCKISINIRNKKMCIWLNLMLKTLVCDKLLILSFSRRYFFSDFRNQYWEKIYVHWVFLSLKVSHIYKNMIYCIIKQDIVWLKFRNTLLIIYLNILVYINNKS